MVRPIFAVFLLLLGLSSPAQAVTITLYDDTVGSTPGVQPWLVYGNDSLFSGGSAVETPTAEGVQLVTDNAVSAGYSNY